jgi:hypothetical protein
VAFALHLSHKPKQFLGYLHANGTDSLAHFKARTETNTAPDKNYSNTGRKLQCNKIEKARAVVAAKVVAATNKVAANKVVAAAVSKVTEAERKKRRDVLPKNGPGNVAKTRACSVQI